MCPLGCLVPELQHKQQTDRDATHFFSSFQLQCEFYDKLAMRYQAAAGPCVLRVLCVLWHSSAPFRLRRAHAVYYFILLTCVRCYVLLVRPRVAAQPAVGRTALQQLDALVLEALQVFRVL